MDLTLIPHDAFSSGQLGNFIRSRRDGKAFDD